MMYKRLRNDARNRAGKTPMPEALAARPPTEPIEGEKELISDRHDLCGCCDYLVEPDEYLWWVPKSGLLRHQQCPVTDDYRSRVLRFHNDRWTAHTYASEAERKNALITALRILVRPDEKRMRAYFMDTIRRVENGTWGNTTAEPEKPVLSVVNGGRT